MSNPFDVLWLSASPSLKYFDSPLIKYLSDYVKIAKWEYRQTKDEGSSLETAIDLLHDCLKASETPVHLIGHGISGVVGLMYARQYPQKVQSLTLLSVASQPANTWHARYYLQQLLFPASREKVLAYNTGCLFGPKVRDRTKDLIAALDKDLDLSPCPHSLFKVVKLPQGGVPVPLLVCTSQTDPVIHPSAIPDWLTYLKPKDQLWECQDGSHFFHYFHPEQVGQKVVTFWQSHQPQTLLQAALVTVVS